MNNIDFFPIETPYNSKDYEMMKNVVNMGIDSNLEGFTKSQFKKSSSNNKFLWNFHDSELPILYKRLAYLYEKTGDYDYQDFLESIQNVADTSKAAITAGEYGAEEMDEMIDPYDPMDANQTINGEPTGNSDLYDEEGIMGEIAFEISETELKEMIKGVLNNTQIEDTIDDDTIGQEMAAENSSDSLTNKHGENLKPETLDEAWGDRYEKIGFAQGDEASEILDILVNDGPEAALDYYKQWHYPGEHDASNEIGAGKYDKKIEKDGYIMHWNSHIPYVSLVYDTQYTPAEQAVDEDSQMKRHLAGQREKNVPLGQHAPHSQAAISENKSANKK